MCGRHFIRKSFNRWTWARAIICCCLQATATMYPVEIAMPCEPRARMRSFPTFCVRSARLKREKRNWAISPEITSFIVPPVKQLLRRSWAFCSRPLITAAPTSTMRFFTPAKRENCIRSLSTQYSIPICPCQPQNSGRPLNPLFPSRWAAPAALRSCRQSTVSLPQ